MDDDPQLVLASASPRRLELLRLAGFEPTVRPAEVDEAPGPDEPPTAYVARLARDKALAVPRFDDEVVLGADTTVMIGSELLGKPTDAGDAARILRQLSGRPHLVCTGVAVVNGDGVVGEETVITEVLFATLSDDDIAVYVESGEPLDKAGAYGIQGRAAAFVERIDGSWTNVVGLPLVETVRLLRDAGVSA